ncbi:MAK10-like protein [Tanacetum coccineum]
MGERRILSSEDPNQHLKDFLKVVDLLDLDGENRERTRLHLFQFSFRDQASNWLERLPAGSISAWEDLTTRFLAKFFPPGRTAKLRNDILMFQQHHGEYLSEAWTHARLSKFEADFKQQQSEMTNKIDTVLKAITDQIAGTLPSDTAHFKEATISQTSLQQPEIETKPPQPEEPEPTLEDEFQDLHLNLLDGKIAVGEGITRSVFSVKGVDLGEEEAPYWTTLGKRESYKPWPSSDGIGVKPPYYARKDFLDCHLPREWEISRDAELNPFKDTLVFRTMVEFLGSIPINLKCNMWESGDLIKKLINRDKPPKDRDGACHAKIRLIDPDGE